MTDVVQVSTATETRAAAEELARSAVERRLAAGAQITGPVVSAFWHLGEFGTGEEWRLVLSTHADRYSELEAHLLERHPWDNPEIAAVAVVAGSPSYVAWVKKSTGPESDGSGS
jgi:periplasmic divalent cation tolerance protein